MEMASALHRGLARKLAAHGGIRLFRFFSRRLDGQPVQPPAGIEIKALSESDLRPFCVDPELELSAEKVRVAYARGDVCAGAFEAGRLVGQCWFAFAPLPHLDDVWVDFPPEVVWVYKSFVRTDERARGIASAMYRCADILGAAQGRSDAFICVESHNLPSVAAAARSGHAPSGYAGYHQRKDGVSTWYSPQSKRSGIRFYVPAERKISAVGCHPPESREQRKTLAVGTGAGGE